MIEHYITFKIYALHKGSETEKTDVILRYESQNIKTENVKDNEIRAVQKMRDNIMQALTHIMGKSWSEVKKVS